MFRTTLFIYPATGWIVLSLSVVPLFGQEKSTTDAKAATVTFTTQQDHQDMLRQLGITKLRPVPTEMSRRPTMRTTMSRWQIRIRNCRMCWRWRVANG